MNIYYVYQYLRSKDSDVAESGTPYYIGKGKDNRAWEEHYRQNGTNLNPINHSLIEILITGLSEKAAHELEVMLIKKYGRVDLGTGILRNLTNGGEGASGKIISASTRIKIGDISRGKPKSAEHKAKIGAAHKGKIVSKESRSKMMAAHKNISEETRLKISISAKNRLHKPLSDETKAKISAAKTGIKRKPFSKDHREKISAANKNRSSETRAKLSLAGKGRTISQETRDKLSLSQKGKPKSPEAIAASVNAKKQNKLLKNSRRQSDYP